MLPRRSDRCRDSILSLAVLLALGAGTSSRAQAPDLIHEPYRLDPKIETRSISFENPTGEPGAGGKAASNLGVGRKGAPAADDQARRNRHPLRHLGPGDDSPHLDDHGAAARIQRAAVIRAWWDEQDHPSIECPIGDFFGFAHGKITSYASAVHSVGPTGGRNIWLPMPFVRHARITFTNEGDKADSSLLPDRLHAG